MSELRVNKRNDLAEVARWLCVDKRTIRRWCEKGIVPGAYRPKNGLGHWRIRNPRSASFTLLNRLPPWHRQSKRGGGEKSSLTDVTVSELRNELSNPNSPNNLARAIYFARYHSITTEELIANRLRTHTPELRRDLLRTSLAELNCKIPSEIWKIAQSPLLANLYIGTLKLHYKQLPITRKGLAQMLGISKASLYRKYSLKQIHRSLSAVKSMPPFADESSAHGMSAQGWSGLARRHFHAVNDRM